MNPASWWQWLASDAGDMTMAVIAAGLLAAATVLIWAADRGYDRAVPGPWDEAVRLGLAEDPGDQASALRAELSYLWSDLDEARSKALNGSWSTGCNWLTERIVMLSRLVGATPWQQVPVPRLLDGTYQGILDAAGISYDPPDMDVVRDLDRRRRAWAAAAYQRPGMVLHDPGGWRGTPGPV